MSSKKSEPPLHLEPRASRQLALALLLIHGAAMAVVLNLGMPVWLMAGLASSVVMSLYFTFNTHVLGRGRFAILSLIWGGDGDWTVVASDGEKLDAEMLPNNYVHPRLVILNFMVSGRGRRAMVLLQDSLDRHTFRRLLARLRLEADKERSER